MAEPIPPPPLARPASLKAGALMIGSGAAFAVMMALVRYTSQELHPFEIAFFRNLFGAVCMLPWFLQAGRRGLRTRRFGLHFLRSLFGMLAMMCFFSSLALLPLGEVTALTFTVPLFATAGAALLLGETVGPRRWSATAIGFLGALIIVRPGAAALQPGALLALAAALLIATALLTVKALSRTENPNAIVLMMGLLMTPMSLVPALFVWQWPEPVTWVWLALTGLAATLGQVLMTRAFAAADASAVMPFDFFRLISVTILGYLMFGEFPDLWTWVGAAVIAGATVYIAHREARLGRRLPKPPTTPA